MFHFLHDLLLYLLERLWLVVDVWGQLVGLEINCILVDIRLNLFVFFAYNLQHFVVLLVHEIRYLLLTFLGFFQELRVLEDIVLDFALLPLEVGHLRLQFWILLDLLFYFLLVDRNFSSELIFHFFYRTQFLLGRSLFIKHILQLISTWGKLLMILRLIIREFHSLELAFQRLLFLLNNFSIDIFLDFIQNGLQETHMRKFHMDSVLIYLLAAG